jgi:hypothetical protein
MLTFAAVPPLEMDPEEELGALITGFSYIHVNMYIYIYIYI